MRVHRKSGREDMDLLSTGQQVMRVHADREGRGGKRSSVAAVVEIFKFCF